MHEVTIKEFPREIAIFIGPRMYAVVKIANMEGPDQWEKARWIAEEVKRDLEKGISRKSDDYGQFV